MIKSINKNKQNHHDYKAAFNPLKKRIFFSHQPNKKIIKCLKITTLLCHHCNEKIVIRASLNSDINSYTRSFFSEVLE